MLRYLLMFFIVIWHSLVHGIGLTNIGGIPDFGIKYLPSLIICSIVCVSVDCFMFISGYFGIRFTWKGFISIVFSCLFYSITISMVLGKIAPPNLLTIFCPITSYIWWFMSCYLIIYLLSNLIESQVRFLDKHKFVLVLILSYCFLYLWHWILGKSGNKPLGQPMLMITIYLVGRYCGIYGVPKWISSKPIWAYTGSTLMILGIIVLLLMQQSLPKSLIWFVYTNGNPLVIIASISLFSIFRKKQFTNEKINYLSGSVLSIYLITDFVFVRHKLNEFLYQYFQSNILLYVIVILIVMLSCICIDQIRLLCFKITFKGLEKIFK